MFIVPDYQLAVDYRGRNFASGPEDPLTLAENAAWRLAWEQPQFSAHAGVSAPQRLIILSILVLISGQVLVAPRASFLVLGWALAVFFTMVALFRCVLLAAGLYAAWIRHTAASEIMAQHDEDLPVYTVLVPLYREPGSVPQLIGALTRLDYPADRLDIKLVLEADDEATLNAVQLLDFPDSFRCCVCRHCRRAPSPKPAISHWRRRRARTW
jgi:hypothetical protein